MKKIKALIKKMFPFAYKIYNNKIGKNRVLKEYKQFKSYYNDSSDNINNIGYKIIVLEHSLEKAMTSNNPRYFGIEKVNSIIKYLDMYDIKKYNKDFAYNIGISILHSYCEFYEKHNWINRDEYNNVKIFLKGKNAQITSGCMEIKKEYIENNNKIDYERFLKSRHAIRTFDKKRVDPEIVKKAAMISQYSPTACNRQMIKIYHIIDEDKRNRLINFLHGLTNFETENSNFILFTYGLSAFDENEFKQGMLNSGLVAMNFVNALHSMNIGSCFLEFNNSLEEECEIKKILNIPSNEKIAISLVIGYYPQKAIIPCSTRKSINEVYKEIND